MGERSRWRSGWQQSSSRRERSGIWWIGAEAVLSGDADVAFCTRDRLDDAGMGEVAVLSLDAFGKGYDDLPVGVTDYATAVRVHGDQVVPERNPGPALEGRSVDDVLDEARSELSATDRVWSSLGWSTAPELIANLVAVFAAGASLVQVAHPDATLQERRMATEKVTQSLDLSSGH